MQRNGRAQTCHQKGLPNASRMGGGMAEVEWGGKAGAATRMKKLKMGCTMMTVPKVIGGIQAIAANREN